MYKQLFYISLLFLGYNCNLSSQQKQIHYFCSDSSSYIIPDLYAQTKDSIYTLINFDSTLYNCYSIEHIADYNKDGFEDILMGNIIGCGGNCCTNSYFLFLYNGQEFIKTPLVGNGEYLESEYIREQWAFLIHSLVIDSTTGHRRWIKEQYILEDYSILKNKEFLSAKINSSEGDYITNWDSTYSQPNAFQLHIITTEGQTIWSLAQTYKTNIASIEAFNNFSTSTVFVGDSIRIPKTDSSLFQFHAIQAGESLWQISQKYKVSVDLIKKVNFLADNSIKIGETLRIPKK